MKYWHQEHEDLVELYCSTKDEKYFNQLIPAFHTLIGGVMERISLHKSVDKVDLFRQCFSQIPYILSHYNKAKGKAYSLLTKAIRNIMIQYSMTGFKRYTKMPTVTDCKSTYDDRGVYHDRLENLATHYEFIQYDEDEWLSELKRYVHMTLKKHVSADIICIYEWLINNRDSIIGSKQQSLYPIMIEELKNNKNKNLIHIRSFADLTTMLRQYYLDKGVLHDNDTQLLGRCIDIIQHRIVDGMKKRRLVVKKRRSAK